MAIPLNPPPRKEDGTFDNWVYRLWQSVQNAGIVNSSGNIPLSGDVTGTSSATHVVKINGVSLSSLSSGLLFNTTGTGTPSIVTIGSNLTLSGGVLSGNISLDTVRKVATLRI